MNYGVDTALRNRKNNLTKSGRLDRSAAMSEIEHCLSLDESSANAYLDQRLAEYGENVVLKLKSVVAFIRISDRTLSSADCVAIISEYLRDAF